MLVRSVFVHERAARLLVHRLKYEAVGPIAKRLACRMEALLPSHCTALVPIPRVLSRRWRYGVDGAMLLARGLSARTGLPVLRSLAVPPWGHRRAGSPRAVRSQPVMTVRTHPPAGAVLLDDVVTTGATIAAAGSALAVSAAVTVTSAPAPGRLRDGPSAIQ